jgi:hypothetical protein
LKILPQSTVFASFSKFDADAALPAPKRRQNVGKAYGNLSADLPKDRRRPIPPAQTKTARQRRAASVF